MQYYYRSLFHEVEVWKTKFNINTLYCNIFETYYGLETIMEKII